MLVGADPVEPMLVVPVVVKLLTVLLAPLADRLPVNVVLPPTVKLLATLVLPPNVLSPTVVNDPPNVVAPVVDRVPVATLVAVTAPVTTDPEVATPVTVLLPVVVVLPVNVLLPLTVNPVNVGVLDVAIVNFLVTASSVVTMLVPATNSRVSVGPTLAISVPFLAFQASDEIAAGLSVSGPPSVNGPPIFVLLKGLPILVGVVPVVLILVVPTILLVEVLDPKLFIVFAPVPKLLVTFEALLVILDPRVTGPPRLVGPVTAKLLAPRFVALSVLAVNKFVVIVAALMVLVFIVPPTVRLPPTVVLPPRVLLPWVVRVVKFPPFWLPSSWTILLIVSLIVTLVTLGAAGAPLIVVVVLVLVLLVGKLFTIVFLKILGLTRQPLDTSVDWLLSRKSLTLPSVVSAWVAPKHKFPLIKVTFLTIELRSEVSSINILLPSAKLSWPLL